MNGSVSTRRTTAPSRTRAIVVAAIALGLALRLAFSFGYWVDKPLTLDEQEYLLLARSVARGDGVKYPPTTTAPATRHFERPPVFAGFLAGVMVLARDPLIAAPTGPDGVPRAFPASSSDVSAWIKIAQAIAGAVGVALIAAVAAQAAGGTAGAFAAAIAAVYPPLAWMSGYVLAEPLYSALALACVWLLNRPVMGRRAQADILAAGLVAGAAVLTKEAMLFFIPLAAGWLLLRRRPQHAAVFCLGVAVVLGPWVARNYTVQGRFVMTAAHGGVTFWTGNNALSTGEGDLAANPEMGRARQAFERRHAGESVQDVDAAYYREAGRFIVEHPARWLVLVARKAFYTFVPIGPSYRLHSRRYFGTSLVSYGLLFPFALAGAIRLSTKRQWSGAWALWLLATSVLISNLVFFPQERFRLPVIDPTLVVLAAAWISSRLDWGVEGRTA